MPTNTKRPTTRDQFEDICLMSYFKRVDKDIPSHLFKVHEKTVKIQAYKTYSKHNKTFFMIGFEKEDVESIFMAHLASYLTLYTLLRETKRKTLFDTKYKKQHGKMPSEQDYLKKDVSNFMAFLKQRSQHLVRIGHQKNEILNGTRYIKKIYVVSPEAVGLHDSEFSQYSTRKLKSLGYYPLSDKDISLDKVFFKNIYRSYSSETEKNGVKYRKVVFTPTQQDFIENVANSTEYEWATKI